MYKYKAIKNSKDRDRILRLVRYTDAKNYSYFNWEKGNFEAPYSSYTSSIIKDDLKHGISMTEEEVNVYLMLKELKK
jgi:hypothetical protein